MSKNFRLIAYWHDDEWCYQEALDGKQDKSDDFALIYILCSLTQNDIDDFVRGMNRMDRFVLRLPNNSQRIKSLVDKYSSSVK